MDKPILYALPCFLGAAFCLALAGLVLARTQRTTVRRALAVALAALGVVQVGNGLGLLAASPADLLWWRRVALLGEILMPAGGVLFSLTFARANGRALMRDWRGELWAVGLLTLLFLIVAGSDRMFALAPVLGEADKVYVALGPTGVIYACMALVAQVLILANLEQTLRRADETTRWYLKLPVIGLGAVSVYLIYQMADLLLYRTWHPGLAWLSGAVTVAGSAVIGYGLMRRPLPDVQIYVSRRVLFESLTFLIVGAVLVGTGAVAEIIRYSGVTGHGSLSTLFVFMAVLGLVLALSSHNARLALGRFVERHCSPHKYDYRARWMEVTETIGGPGATDQIADRVVQILRGMWGARTVAVWMSSTAERDAWARVGVHNAWQTADRLEGSGRLTSWLEAHDGPVVVADRAGSACDERMPPALERAVSAAEAVVLVPLKAGKLVIGWMALGPKADGSPYDHQDMDLLRVVAVQVASRLQHLLLAEDLATAREMEAVYESSAFILHDLKNFTATLSLVVQNVERHGGDAEFQHVAMDAVARTVRKMTELVGMLSVLSRDPRPKLERLDLNVLVDEVLPRLAGAAGVRLTRIANPAPPVEADRDQLQQVVLNLILNAQEAIERDGRITVRTDSDGDTVRLVVEDNGCGMNPATVAGLFRPFRTLKGRGMGIGLYQCRKIVEAHHGTLTVESEPGKGSRFLVRLPVCRDEQNGEQSRPAGTRKVEEKQTARAILG